MKNVIFISWQKHQRTQSFCEKLSIPLYEIVTEKSGVSRYIECFFATRRVLKATKAKTLIIQNPSIVLALTAIFLRPLFGYKLFVDAHNEAIYPFILNNWLIKCIARIIIRKTDLTIVTNNVLAQAVNEYGGKSFILPDLLPNVEPRTALKKTSFETTIITLISTYAPDEPYQEVFMAMKSLGSEYQLCVTGKIPSNLQQNSIPKNIKLLGYLSHDDYWDQLYKSHIIIDLSTMENCLVCGAYEAMAIEKPLILSLNPASIDLFGEFAVHTTNDAKSIVLAIKKISNDYTLFTEKLSPSKIDFLAQEKERLDIFRQILNDRIEN